MTIVEEANQKTSAEDTTATAAPTEGQPENSAQPVFEEIQNMTQQTAVGVLIQAAEMAQKAGILSLRDSVVLAKAIDLILPGKL